MKFSNKLSTERICEICGKKKKTVQIRTRHTGLQLTFCKLCLLLILDGFNNTKGGNSDKNV